MRERRAAIARGEDPDTVPADDPTDPRNDEPEAPVERRPGSRKRRKRR
jgi:hypothetical protein